MKTNNIFTHPVFTGICPVTNQKVFKNESWWVRSTNYQCGIALLGKQIVLIKASGKSIADNTLNLLMLFDQIVAEHISSEKKLSLFTTIRK